MKIRYALSILLALFLLPGAIPAGAVEVSAPCIANAQEGNGWGSESLYMQSESYGALRSFFKFDLSAIPAGATINSAKAHIYLDWGGYWFLSSWPFYAHKVTANWGEAGPMFPAVSDTRLGGPGYFSSAGTWTAIDISTSLVEQWIDSTTPNYGIMVSKGIPSAGEYVRVANRLSANPAYLLIDYTPAPVTEAKLFLSANAGQGNGWSTDFGFQGMDYGALRAYLKWNLSSIPQNANILSASMHFNMGGAYYCENSSQIAAREITGWWSEDGGFQNPPVNTTNLSTATWVTNAGTTGYQGIDLPTSLVQAWVKKTKTNYGVLTSKETPAAGYMTISNRVSQNPPYMMVSYTARAVPPESVVTEYELNSKNTTVTFDKQGYVVRCVSLVDKLTGREMIGTYPAQPGLWKIEFRNSLGSDSSALTLDSESSTVVPAATLSPDGKLLTFVWNNMALGAESAAVDVTVTVSAVGSTALTDWRIYVRNRSRVLGLWGVKFPRVYGIVASNQAQATTPYGFGMVMGDPLHNSSFGFSGRYPHALYTMQFTSLSDMGVNLYLATHDPKGYVKDMRFERITGQEGLVYEVNQLPEDMGVPGRNYDQPYACVLGTFPGDWVDAAKYYRGWVLANSDWMKNKLPLYKRTDISDSVKRLPYWVGFHGMTEDAITAIEALIKYMQVPTGVHMYHWHQIQFDTHYPDFWPPYTQTFAYEKRLHKLQDVTVMPYINNHLMDEQATSWTTDKGWKSVAMTPDGTENTETWSAGTGVKLRPMCPATTYWQEKFNALTVKLVRDLNVDAIYCDQVACVPPDLCFNPTHGHPLGGGCHWVQGHAKQIANIRKTAAAAGKQVFLTSESAAECYDFDSNLRCNEGAPFLTPVWQIVYSGYKLNFGFYFSEQAEWVSKLATQYLWGMQIGWAGQHNPSTMPDTCAFEREVARARYAASDYLALGEMLRNPTLTGSFARIQVSWNNFGNYIPIDWPAVQGSMWKAPNRSIGVALVNMHTAAQTVSFNLNRSELGFSQGPIKLTALYPKNVCPDVTFTGSSLSHTITLPARSAVMVTLTDYTARPVNIVGKASARDFSGPLTDVGLTITSVKNDFNQRIDHVFLDAAGNFTVTDVDPGTYNVAVKAPGFLQKVVSNVVVTLAADGNAGTVNLINGDLDGDNEITSTDLSILGLGLGGAGDSF